jgi:hypothetical protein
LSAMPDPEAPRPLNGAAPAVSSSLTPVPQDNVRQTLHPAANTRFYLVNTLAHEKEALNKSTPPLLKSTNSKKCARI